jgi:hypothetical protein
MPFTPTETGTPVIEIPEGAIAIPLCGGPREMVLAGFRLGIEHAARIIEACTDQQTDAAMVSASPQQCFQVAAMLVRNQGEEAVAAIDASGNWPQNNH